ncbi:hypothetical protein JCM24511_03171 [Saitozyma sp. JCM 24511]|nr:hypothetical protein JCM24511_03171 [Saitozyma sp. JCM 24511]
MATLSEDTMRRERIPADPEGDDSTASGRMYELSRPKDACNKMKIRCIGKDNPPCRRCGAFDLQCTFSRNKRRRLLPAHEGEDASSAVIEPDGSQRLRQLEGQMEAVQTGLQEILNWQRSFMRVQGTIAASEPVDGHEPLIGSLSGGNMSMSTFEPGTGAVVPAVSGGLAIGGESSGEQQSGSIHSPLVDWPTLGSAPPKPDSRGVLSPKIHEHPAAFEPQPRSTRSVAPVPTMHTSTGQAELQHQAPRSPTSSEIDDEDPVAAAASMAPLRLMLSSAEQARLTAENLRPRHETTSPLSRPGISPGNHSNSATRRHPFNFDTTPQVAVSPDHSTSVSHATLGHDDDEGVLHRRGALAREFADPVSLGFCSEQEAERLYNSYFANSHIYIPLYDPAFDTFKRMREHCPLSLTAIIMIGKKAEDNGGPFTAGYEMGSELTSFEGPESELQRLCREHAEQIGMRVLYSPILDIDAVQGARLIGNFSHFIVMGRRRMEVHSLVFSDWPEFELNSDRAAYNHGRPVMIEDDQSRQFGREFLKHPLSIATDSRLVAAFPLHRILRSRSDNTSRPIPETVDAVLWEANREGDDWDFYWNGYYTRFLIRMANLCPHMLDLRQVGKDVELVANKLNQALQGTDHTGDFDFLYAEMLLSGNAEESGADETPFGWETSGTGRAV